MNDNPKLLETENPIIDEVVSIDQCAGTKGAQEMQGVISLGEERELVLPTTPTASQLLNSISIPEEQFDIWPPNIMEPAQATAWVEEIILLDPPRVILNLNWFGVFKNRIAVHNFIFCLNLINFASFSYFSKLFNLAFYFCFLVS